MKIVIDVLFFCAALIAAEALVGCAALPKPTPAQLATTQAIADAGVATTATGTAIKAADTTLATLPEVTPPQTPIVAAVHADLATAATANGTAAADLKTAAANASTATAQAQQLAAANAKLQSQVDAYSQDWFGGKMHRLFWWIAAGIFITAVIFAICDYTGVLALPALLAGVVHLLALGLGAAIPEMAACLKWCITAAGKLVAWIESLFAAKAAVPSGNTTVAAK